MRLVIQRVKEGSVSVAGKTIGSINRGLVVLVGVTHDDTTEDVDYLVNKCINLRIFSDDDGKMNLSLKDIKGELLSISQFTLYADTRKGRRPSFAKASGQEHARKLYEEFNEKIKEAGICIQTGQFGADMDVSLINDGPVTLIIDSLES